MCTPLNKFHGQKGQRDPQVWKRRRTSLQKQKQIGKRWSTLISCIGPGFLLICSLDLATHMSGCAFVLLLHSKS